MPDRATALALAATLGLPLDDVQADTLLRYLALLQRWNATYNLTAVRDPAAMWVQHVVDCLAALPPVLAHLQGTPHPRILDVGSGGGLPGIVWAIAAPRLDITCVDTVGKKAAFIRQVAAELRLPNLHAQHARVEQLRLPPFDLVTSRAFASLADFTRLTRTLVAPGGGWVALKGKPPHDELAALNLPSELFHVEQLQPPGLDAERCLVWIRPGPATA